MVFIWSRPLYILSGENIGGQDEIHCWALLTISLYPKWQTWCLVPSLQNNSHPFESQWSNLLPSLLGQHHWWYSPRLMRLSCSVIATKVILAPNLFSIESWINKMLTKGGHKSGHRSIKTDWTFRLETRESSCINAGTHQINTNN